MRTSLTTGAAALLATAGLAMTAPAVAAPWVRSYVVSAYEPAFYWGGKASYAKGKLVSPGTDCPGGNTPELNYEKEAGRASWRTPAQTHEQIYPKGQEKDLNLRLELVMRALTYRGIRPDVDVYINPFATVDPGQDEVVGKIAEGFNLDGNTKTGGFTSPDGVRGVDNAYYRAWGCMGEFRGSSYNAGLSQRANDKMLEGLYTVVIRLSGIKDPMNDDNVVMEVGYSPDHSVKGSDDHVAGGYSFRVVKTTEYTRMKAKVRNGVVESEQVSELHMPKIAWFEQNMGDADFHHGKMRLITHKDGTVSGLVGGYRDWREVYVEDAFPQDGPTQETRDHQNLVGQYYALKRNADGMPDAKTGRNMGISIAYRFKAVPAFVIDPAVPVKVYIAAPARRLVRRMHRMHDAFFAAVATKRFQPIPFDSREGIPNLMQRPDGTWFVDGKAQHELQHPTYDPRTDPEADMVSAAPTPNVPVKGDTARNGPVAQVASRH